MVTLTLSQGIVGKLDGLVYEQTLLEQRLALTNHASNTYS